jgi:UrcA family protein
MINRSTIAKATFALSFAVAGLGVATPSLAADALPTAEVHLGGLDLNSPMGQKELDRRIHVAALKVCRSTDQRNLTEFMLQRKCYTKAVAQARQQVAQRQQSRTEQVASLSNPVNR